MTIRKIKLPEPVEIMTDYDRLDGPCEVCKRTTAHAVRTIDGKMISTCMSCHSEEELNPDDFEEIGYFPDSSDYQLPSAELLQ